MVEAAIQIPTVEIDTKNESATFIAGREWWNNVLGPKNWNGKFFVGHTPETPHIAVDEISKFREGFINQKLAQHLESGDTVVFASERNRIIMIGNLGLLIVLDSLDTTDLTLGIKRGVNAMHGELEAHISTGRGISFFNVKAGERYLAFQFNMNIPVQIPTIFAVSNPQSNQDHRATLLLDRYKGTKKLVLKSTA